MKSSELDIKILTLSGCRIDKLHVLEKHGNGKYFKDIYAPTIREKIKFCSDYTGVDDIKNANVESINKTFQIINGFTTAYRIEQPKKSIKMDGAKYTFVGSFSKMPASWHEMVRTSNFKENPIRMVSLCYIEQGMEYAEEGENKTIKNPTADRDEVFTRHFPLDEYLSLSAFFLPKFKEWHALSVKMKTARKMNQEAKEKSLESQ